jgi:beta-mannanase
MRRPNLMRALLVALVASSVAAGVLALSLPVVGDSDTRPRGDESLPTFDGDVVLGTAATNAEEMDRTLADMGRTTIAWNVDYVWDDGDLDADTMDAAAARGVTHHVVTVEFWSLEHQEGLLREIAAGAVDENLRRLAEQMADWQSRHPEAEVIVRPLHEANLDSYPWGFGAGNVNGNRKEDLAPAWERIWRMMRDEFPALKFFLCPHGWSESYDWGVPSGQVDYVGHDAFNWSQTSGEWHPPDALLTATVERIRKLYPDKPYVVGEIGTSEPGPGVTGRSKAQWFQQLAAWMRGPAARLGVVAVCYFDHGGRNDWRIYPRGEPGAEASRDAFRRAFADIR